MTAPYRHPGDHEVRGVIRQLRSDRTTEALWVQLGHASTPEACDLYIRHPDFGDLEVPTTDADRQGTARRAGRLSGTLPAGAYG